MNTGEPIPGATPDTEIISGLAERQLPEVSMSFGKLSLAGKQYELTSRTGGGKFSDVIFLGTTTGDPEIAVKLVALGANDRERESFNSEIGRLAKLSEYQRQHNLLVGGSPCTPELLAVSSQKDAKGIPSFFVMSKAEGIPLDEYIRRTVSTELSTQDVVSIGEQACRVLEAVHEGLDASYYDFQPRNFFWDAQRRKLTVIDFNLLAPIVLENGERVEANPVEDLRNLSLMLFRILAGVKAVKLEKGDAQTIIQQSGIDDELKQVLVRGVTTGKPESFKGAKDMREAFSKVKVIEE